MRVRILGSAAGGGIPQWNCGCLNCRGFRLGSMRSAPRSQTQVAVSADDRWWFLLGASPDLRYQIESFPELHPRSSGRNSPIGGAILTCADLDHTLGLLLLREWQKLRIYSTDSIRTLLLQNPFFRLLERMPEQTIWTAVSPCDLFELVSPDGAPSGIRAWMLPLPSQPPAYASGEQDVAGTGFVSALFLETSSNQRLAFVPGLPAISEPLLSQLANCSTVLIDGTFWTNDELVRIEGQGRLAAEIGHMPISGGEGSLARLSSLQMPARFYIHINNTNPLLDEDSREY